MDDSQMRTGPIDEQAAYWLRVLRDEPTLEHRAAFMKWANASPLHAREFALAQEVDDRLQRFYQMHHVDVEALIEQSKREQRSNEQRASTVRIAASIAMLALLSAGVVMLHGPPKTYTTRQEQQLIDLEDGSVVALNAESRMRVAFSAETRDLYLERGQGIFRVRHDAKRPFRVHAGSASIEAIGTQFDVRVAGHQTTIAVVEGVVKLRPSPSTVRATKERSTFAGLLKITAGQSATIRHDGRPAQVTAIDVAAVTAWRQPAEQLEFKNQPLAEIVAELNRHNATPKLTIEGDELRGRRFILVFKNASPEPLLNYLARDGALEIVQEGDDVVIRKRSQR